MTRRELARWAVAGAVALEYVEAAEGPYTGALDGFEGQVDLGNFDAVRYTQNLHDSAPLRMTFQARNREAAGVWQIALRRKVVELLGGFPAERFSLSPTTLEVKDYPSYRRQKFVFQSRPGAWVLGYLLTPKAGRAPYATVVVLPGHGRGVDDIVGIDEQGRDRTERVGYAYDYGIQVTEHGMAALCLEPMAFGCRRDPITKSKGLTAVACQPVAGSALLLGQTILGWRVYDVMRGIDWIGTRKELDSTRVGVMGCSGGGTCALFAAALDRRIQAAFVSSYLNTFRESIMRVSHCIDNYVPGILNWAEMYDVAGLIAPRPLFGESGLGDNIFPTAAARLCVDRARQVYAMFDATDRIGLEVFDGPHSFWGKQGLPFLARHLGARAQ